MGDILLSKSGSLGAPVIVKTTRKLGLFESLAVIKYDRDRLLPEFLCEQLKTDRIQRQFKVETKEKFKYFIKDRRNWGKKMLVIWHI